ncbi:hypothetical protein XELAEV_18003402mg [Xenopus laevis]|nr:hypothetical protein XELAEV_18003402mg [Xenopus laevis]
MRGTNNFAKLNQFLRILGILCLFLQHQTGAVLEVTAPPTQTSSKGSDILIPCSFHVDKFPADPKLLDVKWSFNSRIILIYSDDVSTTDPRFSLNSTTAPWGVASLSVSNTQVSDGGRYTCTVTYGTEWQEKEIKLIIQASPQINITNNFVLENEESALSASITGFYPQDIDIKWLREGEIMAGGTVLTPQRNADGTYRVIGTLTIVPTKENRNQIFSIRVQHESLSASLQKDFHLLYAGAVLEVTAPPTQTSSKGSDILIPCTFQLNKFPAHPKLLSIRWDFHGRRILTYSDGASTSDPQFSLNSNSATRGEASLSVSNTQESDGGTYTCSITYGTEWQAKEIILEIQGVVLEVTAPSPQIARKGSNTLIPCTFYVSKFPADPKLLDVKWYFNSRVILIYSDDVITTDPRFSLNSTTAPWGVASLSVSNTQVSDGGTYTCTVDYSSDRQNKEILLEIQAPPQIIITNKVVSENKESVLRASITGFYPQDLDVKWLRDGEILPGVTVNKSQRDPDGTHSTTSTVTIVPTKENRNQIFSIQVQHKSLSAPLQEDFQLIYEAAPSINFTHEPFYENKEQTLMCRVWGYYPESIAVSWLVNGSRVEASEIKRINSSALESSYQFLPTAESQGMEISCVVEHQALTQPLVQTLKVELTGNEHPSGDISEHQPLNTISDAPGATQDNVDESHQDDPRDDQATLEKENSSREPQEPTATSNGDQQVSKPEAGTQTNQGTGQTNEEEENMGDEEAEESGEGTSGPVLVSK